MTSCGRNSRTTRCNTRFPGRDARRRTPRCPHVPTERWHRKQTPPAGDLEIACEQNFERAELGDHREAEIVGLVLGPGDEEADSTSGFGRPRSPVAARAADLFGCASQAATASAPGPMPSFLSTANSRGPTVGLLRIQGTVQSCITFLKSRRWSSSRFDSASRSMVWWKKCSEGVQKRSVTPTVAAIEHHAPPVRGGDHGTLAVTDIEDFNLHGDLRSRRIFADQIGNVGPRET